MPPSLTKIENALSCKSPGRNLKFKWLMPIDEAPGGWHNCTLQRKAKLRCCLTPRQIMDDIISFMRPTVSMNHFISWRARAPSRPAVWTGITLRFAMNRTWLTSRAGFATHPSFKSTQACERNGDGCSASAETGRCLFIKN